VTWPHLGPQIELSLASEALGLVRSLDWDIVKGPTEVIKVKDESNDKSEAEDEYIETRGRNLP